MINLLKEFTELLNWSEKLEVILDNFINVYDNKVDYDFWDQIFLLNISKMKEGYGWHDSPAIELMKYDGWFIYFFPYLAFDATGYERDENYYRKQNIKQKLFRRLYNR